MGVKKHSLRDIRHLVHQAFDLLRQWPVGHAYTGYVLLAFALRRANVPLPPPHPPLVVPKGSEWSRLAASETKGIATRLRDACEELDAANATVFCDELRALCRLQENRLPDSAYEADRLVQGLFTLLANCDDIASDKSWRQVAEGLSDGLTRGNEFEAGAVPASLFRLIAGLTPCGDSLFCGSVVANLARLNEFADHWVDKTNSLTAWVPATCESELAPSRLLSWMGNSVFSVDRWRDHDHSTDKRLDRQFDNVFGMLAPERTRLVATPLRATKPLIRHDLVLVQRMLSRASSTGRVCVATFRGILFAGGQDQSLRKELVTRDLLDAVISLPVRMVQKTSVATAVLLMSKRKAARRENKIVFVDTSDITVGSSPDTALSENDIRSIYDAVSGLQHSNQARTVEAREVVENSYNLDVARYVEVLPRDEPSDVARKGASIVELIASRNSLEARVLQLLEELSREA